MIDEPETADVQAVWLERPARAASVALLAETRAALAAARRVGRQTAIQHAEAVRALAELWLEIDGIELTEALAMRAGELAEMFALRGYDAIHLASAEAVADPDTVLITADHELASAAVSLGIETLIPATV